MGVAVAVMDGTIGVSVTMRVGLGPSGGGSRLSSAHVTCGDNKRWKIGGRSLVGSGQEMIPVQSVLVWEPVEL